MSEHVYKIVELAGSSPESVQAAIESAVSKASTSLRNLRWFEVIETRGQIRDGTVSQWQVVVKVGFSLDGE
jgi:hypothetical protein